MPKSLWDSSVFYTSCNVKDGWGSRPIPGKYPPKLPKKPWLLKYRFPNPVFFGGRYQDLYVGYLQYVAHAGYFRPGGFPSLRRADFESSEAERTPILYCKSLLEQEDRKGTNVLFGDGHVEYTAAEELDKLKAASAPSEDKTR